MTGEPVASNFSMVSLTAASYSGSRAGSSLCVRATASMSRRGLGMLPIGSVGMVIGVFANNAPYHRFIHLSAKHTGARRGVPVHSAPYDFLKSLALLARE